MVLDFLEGYNKQLLEDLEKVGLNNVKNLIRQAMSKTDIFAKLRNSESFHTKRLTSLVPHMYVQLSRICTAQNCEIPQYSW